MEECPLREDYGAATAMLIHRANHVLHPSEVGGFIGWDAPNVAPPRVRGELLGTPVLEGERRVCNHTVESLELPRFMKSRVAEGVSLGDAEILGTV